MTIYPMHVPGEISSVKISFLLSQCWISTTLVGGVYFLYLHKYRLARKRQSKTETKEIEDNSINAPQKKERLKNKQRDK